MSGSSEEDAGGRVSVGSLAPDFTLPDQHGEPWSLSVQRGRVVGLLFYPGDETLVCTRQLCAARDRWTEYQGTGAAIVGISPGTCAVHKRFAERHRLPMPLLVDENRLVTKLYTAHTRFPVWATRALIVLDAAGFVRHRHITLRAFRPSDDDVLKAIRLAQHEELAESDDQR